MAETTTMHMDLGSRVMRVFNTRIVFTFDVEIPISMPGNMYLADGRCSGTSWDENADDRGSIYLSSSRILQCTYKTPSLKVDGVSVAMSSTIPIGRHVLEITCNTASASSSAVTTLFARYEPTSTNKIEAWKGKIYRAKLEVPGTEQDQSFDFRFGPFIDAHPPTGRLFKDKAGGPTAQNVRKFTKPSAWTQNGETFTKTGSNWNRLYVCDSQLYPPALLRVQFKCVTHGEGHIFYTNRYGTQVDIPLSSNSDYDIYCPVGKDGRVFFDSLKTGMQIKDIVVTKVFGCLLHVARGATSHWVRTT